MEEVAEIEALRAAYLAVVGNAGRVVSGAVMRETLQSIRTPHSAAQTSVQGTKPETGQKATPAETTASTASRGRTNQTPRSVKLPKFLVGTAQADPLETLNPTQPSAKSRNVGPKTVAQNQPLAQRGFTPLPQGLFQQEKAQVSAGQTQTVNHSNIKNAGRATAGISEKLSGPSASLPKGRAAFADFLTEKPFTPKSVGEVPVENNADWVDKYQRYESMWIKLFERPRLLLGMLGLGIVSCSVYIALGYWWFGSSPISQAAEPVNMLDVQDMDSSAADDATSTFNNIRSLQNGMHPAKLGKPLPAKPKSDGVLLAQAVPAASGLAGEPAVTTEPTKYEPTGRVDPFAPLVSSTTQSSADKPVEIKKDILADLQYTGFIGDINSKDKLAIIRVSDSVTGVTKTQIKKVGESFAVDGESVLIKGISKKSLLLRTQGETRQLGLQQYQAAKPAASDPTPGGMAPNAMPAGVAGASGAPGPVGLPGMSGPSGARTGANISLREPNN